MTDRELLEMAAKAAGIVLTWGSKYMVGDDEVDCTDIPYVTSESPDVTPYCWNPLEDDGDALRLAVKMGMSVNIFPNDDARTECASHLQNNFVDEAWRHHTDPYTATSRAIVRCAAEIGKAMK